MTHELEHDIAHKLLAEHLDCDIDEIELYDNESKQYFYAYRLN